MVLYEYNIRKSDNYYIIIPTSSSTPQKGLNVEIGTGLLHEYDFKERDLSYSNTEGKIIYGVLGIVNIFPVSYLWVISEFNDESALKVNGHNVYEIKKIDLLWLAENDRESNAPLKDGIKRLLSSGFYYSYDYDLTKRMQRSKGDDRYWWNRSLYDEFNHNNISSWWVLKIIQGYVGYSKVIVESKSMEVSLISRRSIKMAGTRYGKRGIDDNGNVANFVETEQIMNYKGYNLSFVQIRGSVPAFWEQTGITADLQLTRNLKMDQIAFDKHFKDLIGEYDKVLWANLLNNKRSYELVLIKRFEELIKIYQGKNNRYLFFNFHTEWSKDNFSALDDKLKLSNLEKHFDFYISKGSKVIRNQIGVMRTNWLDCLDRTNICQAYYAFKAFHLQLNYLMSENALNIKSVELKSGEDDEDGNH